MRCENVKLFFSEHPSRIDKSQACTGYVGGEGNIKKLC